MKKVLSVVLAILMFAGSFVFSAAAENELVVMVASDLHLNAKKADVTLEAVQNGTVSDRGEIIYVEREDYKGSASSGQLQKESYAIIDAWINELVSSTGDVVLITGDLADRGLVEEHEILAFMLKKLENAGKEVFVVPGNHDLFETTTEEFAEIYADYGFDNAIARDTASLSYVAELGGDYRLLAIDSTDPGESPNGITAERVAWIEQQAKKAQEDGKKLVAMMHHNLMEHYIFSETFHKGAVISSELGLKDIFAKYGVKYTFTAHTHNQDIKAYTDSEGNVIYDAVTNSLTAYNSPYRIVTFGENVTFTVGYVEAIDTSLLPNEQYTQNEMQLIESNFPEFSKNVVYLGLERLISSYLKPAQLKRLLNINKNDNPEMCAIIDKVGERLYESVNLPLYKADETEEGKSIESFVELYDTTLPASEHETLLKLAVSVYQAQVIGDENYPTYSAEVIIFTRGLAACINYALAEVSDEEYAQVLSFLTELLGFKLPVDFFVYAGSGIKRFEGAEIFITTAILPLIPGFTVDTEPDDNNVTLPGYSDIKEEKVEKSFFEKVRDFFKKIIDFFKSIFALFPGVEF